MELNHIKPHGAFYIQMQHDAELNDAAMRAISHFKVPVYGLPGTLHESGARKHNVPFIPEAFVDVNYDDEARLMGVPGSRKMSPEEIYEITKNLCKTGSLPSVNHKSVDLHVGGNPFTICIHSDFKACRENLAAARKAVDEVNKEMYTQ